MNLPEREYINKVVASIAIILNKDKTIKHVNDAGLSILKAKEKDIVGKSIRSLTNSTATDNFPIEPSGNEHKKIINLEHWEEFFNAIPMPVFVKDRQHRWVIFNDALCRLQNKTRTELQNKNDYDFFSKIQADAFWKEEEIVFKTGKEIFSEESSLRNGVESYVLIKKTIIKTNDGEDYLIGCCIDISQRKKAELALIESERRFRSLIQNSPDIILILEKDNTIKYTTPSFFRLSGYTEDEVLKQSIVKFIHAEDVQTYHQTMKKIIGSSDKGLHLEFRLRKRNGQYVILMSFFKNLAFDPAIGGIVINSNDITLNRNQADEIMRMNNLLENDNNKLKVDLKNEVEARVDFKPLNYLEFQKIHPDDESCLKYLADLKWLNGYNCKKCGNAKASYGKLPYSKRCTICGYDESATTNTIFYRVKFSINKALYIFCSLRSQKKITAQILSTQTNIRKDTCSIFKRKIIATIYKDNKLIKDWERLIITTPDKKRRNLKVE